MRDFDATVHNRIVNHPAIKPHFMMADPLNDFRIDFADLAERPDHYVLLHNGRSSGDLRADAAMIFDWSAPDVWEAHLLFLPSCRGRDALAAVQDFGRTMFEEVGARLLWGQITAGNRGARWFARQIGGKTRGGTHHHIFGLSELFVCDRDDWEARRAK